MFDHPIEKDCLQICPVRQVAGPENAVIQNLAEVRVQHETFIYMRDTFSSHFEPKKIDRVGRRGQKQPKLGIFEGTNIGQFWLFCPSC